MAEITVVTGSLPERQHMLGELLTSVQNQTVKPDVHLIGVDWKRRGIQTTYNQLAAQVDTEWMTCQCDDDLLFPQHLEVVGDYADAHPEVDVISSYCECVGGRWDWYNVPYNRDLLEEKSIVAGWALVRTRLWKENGGLPDEWGSDWKFWKNLARQGANIVTLPVELTTYRFHEGNDSRQGRLNIKEWVCSN